MCGIVAIFDAPGAEAASFEAASRILGRMAHRGEFDKQAEFGSGNGWVMGANRLAITSQNDQRQPISSPDGFVTLVFNGEVYNYKDFFTRYDIFDSSGQGDGLAIAVTLSRANRTYIREFDGMFSIIWTDSRTGSAYVARDRLGIKPLYYANLDDALVFTSEIKALAPERKITEIKEVHPGTILEIRWRENTLPYIANEEKFFDLFESTTGVCSSADLFAAIEESVKAQCAYRGKIGIYLSGGVDSAGVYCLAKRFASNDVVALTLTSATSSDGQAAARLVAEMAGAIVERSCLSEEELFYRIPETIAIVESFEPNLVRQSTVYRLIAEVAPEVGLKVILCGEGADELFCGYPDFIPVGEDWNSLRRSFLQSLHRTQLQRVDRMSMWVTTEVRVPYLANRVIDIGMSGTNRGCFIDDQPSGILNKKCLREAYKKTLPDWVRLRPKVILSEGVGLAGNHPKNGLFRKLADKHLSLSQAEEIIRSFPEWNLKTQEEAYYFRMFHDLGYSKATFAQNRVVANTIHSGS